MKRLGATVGDEDLTLIFQSADLYSSNELSFKEFLVTLCVAYLLDLIPQFETAEQMLAKLAELELHGADKAARVAAKAEKAEAKREEAESKSGAVDALLGPGLRVTTVTHDDSVVSPLNSPTAIKSPITNKRIGQLQLQLLSILPFLTDTFFFSPRISFQRCLFFGL